MIRKADGGELAFVASSWVRSYEGSPDVREVARDVYVRGMNRLVDGLIARSRVTVADEDGLIAGWLCVEEPATVHYVYVRQLYRGRGIARALVGELAAAPCVYTHRSPNLRASKIPSGWRFDPFAAMVTRTGTGG